MLLIDCTFLEIIQAAVESFWPRPPSTASFAPVVKGRLEGEEEHGARHFIRGAVALHRRDVVAERLELGALGFGDAGDALGRRIDEAGADAVDPDTARQKLGGEHGCEGDECRLACAVDAHARMAALVGDGGGEDDRSAFADQRRQPLHGEEGALGVDGKLAVIEASLT